MIGPQYACVSIVVKNYVSLMTKSVNDVSRALCANVARKMCGQTDVIVVEKQCVLNVRIIGIGVKMVVAMKCGAKNVMKTK